MKLKKVDVYVRRERLSFVLMALDKLPDFPGVSVLDCQGFGKGGAPNSNKRIVEYLIEPNRHVKLEIICEASAMEEIITTIKAHFGSGRERHGKIFVLDVEAGN